MSFFDTGSIWESGLLFSQSKISTILEGNSTPSLEELLLEDDFIQETQSQSHLLMNFLQSGQTMHRLLYYLTVPQLVENEERAYRFPYMSCEALCCNVQPLTDAITSRTAIGKDHLSMLFGGVCNYPGKDGMSKLQAKARRRYRLQTNSTEQAFLEKFEEKIENGSSNVNVNVNFRPLKPYLAGYVVKVITMLCKRSPAAIMRFLDSTPHILKGLVQHLENSSVTLLLPILFNLPFDRSVPSLIENDDDDDDVQGNGMRRLCLSRFDNPNIENIPTLLLGTISDALDLGFRYAESVTMRRSNLTLSSVPHTSATACANAADVIVSLVKTAASSTPHKKFSQEGYNSEHRFGTDVNKGGGIQGVVSSDDKMTSYDDDDDDPSLPGPLSLVNAELDMAYHTPLSNDSPDSISLRFLKSLRDGRHATSVQKIAFRSARLLTLLQASSAKGRLGLASGAVDEALGPIQIICESAFRVLSVILDACAKSCMQQQVFKNTSISTPPRILTLLCTNVEESIQGQVQDSTTVSSSSSSSSSMSSSTSTISELVKFLNVLSSCALDASVVASNKNSRSGPVPPSYENAPKLGSAGLALARALGNFVRCGSWLEVNTTIAKCLIFPCLLDTVQAFPWHSLLHRSVTDAIIDSLRHSSRNFKTNYTGTIVSNHQQQLSAAISSLFFEGKLLTRIVSILKQCRLPTTLSPIFRSSLVSCIPTSLSSVRFNDITSTTPSSESTTPISPPPLSRSTASSGFSTSAELGAAKEFVGYVGHFLLIANTIVSLHAAAAADGILNTLSSNILEKHSDFWALVHHELAVANVTRGVLNGGLAPDTKASGHVGANADATGSRPSTSSSTNTMSLTGENTSDEEVDDEDALMHKINRPHGDEDDDDDDENNNNEEENEEEELERERERNERVRSIERARQIVQLAMSDDDNDEEEERNTNEGNRKQQEDDFDFDIPQSQSSINTVWNVESQGNDFSAFSAFNDEGDEEETTSTGTGKDTSEDWTFSFATSSPAAAAPISATLISESESAVTAGTLSTSPKGLMSISSPTMSFSNEIEQVVASTTNSPKTLTDMSSLKVVTSTFLEEDVFGQLDDEFLTTSSILPTNTTVSISTTSVASEKATTATTSIDDDVFGGGGQIEDDPFGGSTSSFSSITSSIQTTTGENNVVDDPFAF